jgi:hypothetical protein
VMGLNPWLWEYLKITLFKFKVFCNVEKVYSPLYSLQFPAEMIQERGENIEVWEPQFFKYLWNKEQVLY